MNYNYKFDEINEINHDNYNLIELMDLNDEEKEEINPLVPPTSGLRMEIFDVSGNDYTLTKKKLFHFLRVIKSISVIGKKELQLDNPSVLIVSDDRPSADLLLDYTSRIFTYDNYKIYHQSGKGATYKNSEYVRGYSRMSAPYASASVALFEEIDIVVMITASHNELLWNGLKFYIKRPIPISGGVMKAVSEYALSLTEIKLSKNSEPILIDAEAKNNEYIRKLVSKIIDCSILKGKKIILWPFLGIAPEIISLLESYEANVILIDESNDPPDPTVGINENKLKQLMDKEDVKISILLDADRDRLVFLIRSKNGYVKLTSNELYTSMMNILSSELGKNFVNVRTIPSDPRCDQQAALNFIAGVGYKHLGLIQYMAGDKEVPASQLKTAILYSLKDGKFIKLHGPDDVKDAINRANLEGDVIFALWEESGGHTFNVLKAQKIDGTTILKTDFPLIGDKYPAIAILVLCSLLEMGYDLTNYLDQTIMGTRTTVHASDEMKLRYIEYFAAKIGDSIDIANKEYEIGSFSNLSEKISIIFLQSKDSTLYLRPSGTGPSVRVYIFGDHLTYESELQNVAEFLKNLKV